MAKKKSDTKPKSKKQAKPARDIQKHEWTRATLMRLSRDELNEIALGLNINPRRASNKGVLTDAILLEQNDGMTEGKKLTAKQELFCELYASDREFFGNGTQAYIEAYDVDVSKPASYAAARNSAYLLLTNIDILKRIDEIQEAAVLNDNFVDKQIGFWIQQRANPMASISAIKEYNKLKKRVGDAMMQPVALTQNNFNVSIRDERGKQILEQHTQFMLDVTKSPTPPEVIENLRNAKDYAPAQKSA